MTDPAKVRWLLRGIDRVPLAMPLGKAGDARAL